MKKILLHILTLLGLTATAQQNYCDFEGNNVIVMSEWSGVLDSIVLNTDPDSINMSGHCAKYIRSSVDQYDYIKLLPYEKLADVTPYANSDEQASTLKMNVYSTAPVGTEVMMQLGKKGNENYPAGIHSEYIATTKSKNTWETLIFKFVQIPQGSAIDPTQVDKVVILFHPNAYTNEVFYFDDVTGPELMNNTGVANTLPAQTKLFQNNPNPAKETTQISFQLNAPGFVSLRVYDLLGNSITSILTRQMGAGTHTVPLSTEDIPNGVYFCVLKHQENEQVMRMIVSK